MSTNPELPTKVRRITYRNEDLGTSRIVEQDAYSTTTVHEFRQYVTVELADGTEVYYYMDAETGPIIQYRGMLR